MRKILIGMLILIMLFIPVFIFAADEKTDDAGYIDLKEAQEMQARLEKTNTELNARIVELQNQNLQMNNEINKSTEKLAAIRKLIEECKQNNNALYEQSLIIIDEDAREKAENAYDVNRETIQKLYAKDVELERLITTNKQLIAGNDHEINTLTSRINLNIEQINEIKAAMKKTNSKITEIDSQIDKTAELEEEAEQLIK